MLKIHKKLLLDENQKPFAVQIPIEEYYLLEEAFEDYGLSKMIDEVKNDERFSKEEAKRYYQSLLNANVES